MTSTEEILTGKELAKLNKRKRFYNKFERQIQNLETHQNKDKLIPLMYKKKSSLPEYDDLALIINDFSEDIKNIEEYKDIKVISEESKTDSISLPDLDEGYFLKNMSKNGFIKILQEETYENDDGSIRKGSTGSINDYNYQSAFNFYIEVLDKEKFLEVLEKEKENPTEYDIQVQMKKMPKKRYIKTFKYPRRRRR